jgi:hypothetical protein
VKTPLSVRKAVDKYQKSNPNYRKYQAAYRVANRNAIRERNAKWRETHPERDTGRVRKWRQEKPERPRAHLHVQSAVKNGKLKAQPCKVCFATPTQAHHPDYSQPLEVIWLCALHHRQEHTTNA